MVSHEITKLIQSALQVVGIDEENITLSHPTDPTHGDYATSIAMKLAKQQGRNPMDVAQKIVDALPKNEVIDRVEVVKPGFINIHLSPTYLLKILSEYSSKEFNVSNHFPKKEEVIIVEYSSPNIAKPFTIGHLRSTIIGDAVANILTAIGYDVKRDNHVGDWGTQFGKLIFAVETWGSIEKLETSPRPIKDLVELYVKFHDEAEKNPDLEDRAREKFRLLENGDEKMKDLWNKCVNWSWKEFDSIYKKLNITFTENDGRGYGESFFENKLSEIIKLLEDKNILTDSQGAKIVEFPNDELPPLMIQKSDGASLYATRDLATDKFRKENYENLILIINEVGAEQSLYFKQLYELESRLGWFTKNQRVHLKHGLYRFKDQKMSTRKGNTIWLEEVISEAVNRAKVLGKDADNSEAVAVASLKWNDLKHSPAQDIIFDWDVVLNMQGNSGPYMLYAVVRANSILQGVALNDLPASRQVSGREVMLNQEERRLLSLIVRYPEVIMNAVDRFSPSDIATFLYSLAQEFNLFYQKHQVLKADEKTKNFRLHLTRAVANVLTSGLNLLGIQTVAKM